MTPPSTTSATSGAVLVSPLAASREVVRSSSLWRDAFRRLLRNRLAVAGGVVVIVLCLLAIFADVLAPFSYTKTNFGRLNEAPTRDYPLDTDQLGRDMLSRRLPPTSSGAPSIRRRSAASSPATRRR